MAVDAYRSTIEEDLAQAVEQRVAGATDGQLTFAYAFNRVAAEWLGYDLDDDDTRFVDGEGDRGVDWWYSTDRSFDLFQCKTHEPNAGGQLNTGSFGSEGVQDLDRALKLLTSGAAPDATNRRLVRLLHAWEDALNTAAQDKADDRKPVRLNLHLVILGDELTPGGRAELESLQAVADRAIEVRGAPVEVRVSLVTLGQLIGERWREDNRDWVDSKGSKRNRVDFTPEQRNEDRTYVGDAKGCVFYCRARDLVAAFEQFGYQIFEPNVRCNITKSKVNAAIRESVQHMKTRHDFKFLNNGLTVVCTTYQLPSPPNRLAVRVQEPGIVNGLQTVVALHEAYGRLTDEEKADFDENCYVLVRLIRSDSVADVNGVVRATNTQNPMQPRNLRSNSPEQLVYEQAFAGLGWFYERKQGAWDAFTPDPGRWRSLPNRKPKHFQYSSPGPGAPRQRRVDNEVLAQSWLAFIGLSNQAVHQKRYLFDEDKWYNLAFKHRTLKHGADLNFAAEIPEDASVREGPSHRVMLAAYLARSFAKAAAPSAKENRDQCRERLGISPDAPNADVDSALADDASFLRGQVIGGMSFVFVEFFGYMLYRGIGERIHASGGALLGNGLLAELVDTNDAGMARDLVTKLKYEEDDVLAVAWEVFNQIIHEMVGGDWKTQYRNARSRSTFNHSVETRNRIKTGIDGFHEYTHRDQWARVWARGIKPGRGLFGFFQDALLG